MNKINIFLLLIVGLFFSGCLVVDTDLKISMKEKIVGEWKLVRKVSPTDGETTSTFISLDFKDNGIYTVTSELLNETFTYPYDISPLGLILNNDTVHDILSLDEEELITTRERIIFYYEKVN
ncbi:MAG: hypothetical protein ACPG19_07090 [Saprospiraceae bacterium]